MKNILKIISLNETYVIEIYLYLRWKNKRPLLFIFKTKVASFSSHFFYFRLNYIIILYNKYILYQFIIEYLN